MIRYYPRITGKVNRNIASDKLDKLFRAPYLKKSHEKLVLEQN